MELALNRLRFPAELSDKNRQGYEEYLKKHMTAVAKWTVKQEEVEGIRFLQRRKLWTEQSLQAGMDFAAEGSKTEILSIFMDIRKDQFQRRKRHLSYRVFIKQVEKKSNGQRKIENNRETIEKDRLENISRKILVMARNELYMKMRFLDVALSSLPFVLDTGAEGMGTDGLYLYYDPQYLGGLFREDRVMVNRIYLHLVLHGIFRHMIRRKGREERLYHLSCDIAVESIIDELQYRCVMRPGRSQEEKCTVN